MVERRLPICNRHGWRECRKCRSDFRPTAMDGGSAENAGAIFGQPPWMAGVLWSALADHHVAVERPQLDVGTAAADCITRLVRHADFPAASGPDSLLDVR